jgi:DNA-binding LacI/PurR family transcriptional regulator
VRIAGAGICRTNIHIALAALRDELRIAVPSRIAVVGFDDIALTTDVPPALTTVLLSLEQIGQHGMRLLPDEQSSGLRTVRIPARLIARDSAGPARS